MYEDIKVEKKDVWIQGHHNGIKFVGCSLAFNWWLDIFDEKHIKKRWKNGQKYGPTCFRLAKAGEINSFGDNPEEKQTMRCLNSLMPNFRLQS